MTQRRGPVETFPRAGVEPKGDGVQRARGETGQVGAVGQLLAQQAIGVLMGAALPPAVSIRKEHPDREPLREAFVFGHRFTPIIG